MSEVVISAPGIGVGCRTTSASVSEGCAADAARGAAAAKPAAAAAWKKSRRSQPEVLLLRIGPVQSIDLSPQPLNSMVSSRFNSDLGRDRFGRQAFTPLCHPPDNVHPRQRPPRPARDNNAAFSRHSLGTMLLHTGCR